MALVAVSCGPSYRDVQAEYYHGNLPNVLRLTEKGLQHNSRRDSPAYWQFRLLRAEALLAQGKEPEALALIKDPVPGALGQLEVRRLVDLAAANAGRAAVALQYLEKAQSQAEDTDLRIQIAHLQGIDLFLTGHRAPGEAKVHEALGLATKAGRDFYAARTLKSLCYFRKEESHYSEAVDFCESALALENKSGLEHLKAQTLLNLGYLYAFFGDEERSVKIEEEAIKIFERVQDEPDRIDALGELGLVLGMERQPDKAIAPYREAYRLAMQTNDAYDAQRIAPNLALAYVDLANWKDAEIWNRRGNPESPFVMRNTAAIALGRGQRDEFFRLCRQALATANTPALRWQVHGDMARAYADSGDFKNGFLEYDQALGVFEDARSQARNSEMTQITFLPRLTGLYQDYVDALIRGRNEPKALEVIEESRARVLAQRFGESGWIKPRRRADSPNTVFLSFWIAPKRSFAWLFSSAGKQTFELPGAELINKAVAEFKEKVENQHKDPLAAGFEKAGADSLWDVLLKQAAPHIPKDSRVVVIPDGPLHQLNLETLVVPGPHPHYWLQDVELVIAPSLAMAPAFPVQEASRAGGEGPKILLIGAPEYNSPGYRPLPYAERELQEIRAKFTNPPPRVIEKQNATPQAYFASGPEQFGMIHFAAHADAERDNPLDSAVILSHDAAGSYKLYARDIYRSKTPIHADLVTVSACRSAGVKAYAGEGLIGFAWVFLASGARNVIAGLWDVDDESSSTLMTGLYSGIAKGQPPATALRQAKLKLLADNAEPYYWGALQIYSAAR